jgi:hypothetical protein
MENSDHQCECGCGLQTRLDPAGKPRRYCQGHNSKRGAGGGWEDQGYRFISVNGRRIAEHRSVMEQALGRPLEDGEVVHHIDHDSLNNQRWNLQLMRRSDHARLHFTGRKVRYWSDDERQLAYDLHLSGMRIDHIALAIGRPYSSTRDAIAKWRTRTQPSTSTPEPTSEQAEGLEDEAA